MAWIKKTSKTKHEKKTCKNDQTQKNNLTDAADVAPCHRLSLFLPSSPAPRKQTERNGEREGAREGNTVHTRFYTASSSSRARFLSRFFDGGDKNKSAAGHALSRRSSRMDWSGRWVGARPRDKRERQKARKKKLNIIENTDKKTGGERWRETTKTAGHHRTPPDTTDSSHS